MNRSCGECGGPVVRKHATGRWPKFCADCGSRRMREYLADKQRKRRANLKVERQPVSCAACSAVITPAQDGPLPTWCAACTAGRRREQAGAHRRAVALKREEAGRWATCREIGCGVQFRCAPKGPLPQWCPSCQPKHVYDYRADQIAPVRQSVVCVDCHTVVPLVRKGYSRRRCDPCSDARRNQMARQWWVDHPELLRLKRRERGRWRRAVKRSVPRERFRDQEIFERDGWICQLGMHPVDPAVMYPDPGCATIDHILPRSYQGWSHTRANVRLACLACNNRRQNKVSDSDLRILGLRREDLHLIRTPQQRRSAATGRYVRWVRADRAGTTVPAAGVVAAEASNSARVLRADAAVRR